MRVNEQFYFEQTWTDSRDEVARGDDRTVLLPDDTLGLSSDQNVVDELGASFGLLYDIGEELHCGEKEFERDRHRWELDPASSEDYAERSRLSAGWRWWHFGH